VDSAASIAADSRRIVVSMLNLPSSDSES
jgi:hypothetical protein